MTSIPDPAASSAASAPADEQLIRSLEDERYAAIVDGDYDKAASLWDDRLSYIHSSAQVDTKASYLEKLRSGYYDYHSIDHPIERVVFAGGLAFVYGRMIADIHAGGAPKHLDSITTAVWGPDADGWKLLHFQSTPIPH